MQTKEAGTLTTSDSLEIAPGRSWEVGNVEPAEDSGGQSMVRVELIPGEQGACELVVPASMPVSVE